ncbi:MAG: DUF512 domain-containing protein [Ruminococcus sp.]|nr:DUF512 domain-containing protein [Ruminococcus sp.]
MSVTISSVQKKSPAAKKGIKAGYILNSINSHEINDVLDYQFYAKESIIEVAYTTDKGKRKTTKIHKREDEDIGLEFETYLMDKQMRCKNKCIFCFIDQLPSRMRESLYFKDDDSRMSFLFGNYITLTNLTEHDVERIIEMHISPVNVSVHTMNPELRVKMMKNKNGGESLKYLERFAAAGIKLNAQLVLCPGINDGAELEFSLNELSSLYPSIQSIAAVPVGLTKFREGLADLACYTECTAKQVIDSVNSFGDKFKEKHGTRLAFCADEFYLMANMRLPSEEYYEDYPQIENGVGLWKSLESEFYDALNTSDEDKKIKRNLSLATGVAAYPLMKTLCKAVGERFQNVNINVYEIKNDFFGHNITVAGLITGRDLINQLKDKFLNDKLIIPSVMLRSEQDVFLDDVSIEQAQSELGVRIEPVGNDGYELLDIILN